MHAPSLDIDRFDEAVLASPCTHHPAIRDAGTVVWFPAISVFGVARYREAKQVLEDHATFVSGRGVGLADFAAEEPWRSPSLLLEADPPLHDRTRGSLKALRIAWQAKAVALVDELVARRRFDAVSDLA